jgi:hypothetical protein
MHAIEDHLEVRSGNESLKLVKVEQLSHEIDIVVAAINNNYFEVMFETLNLSNWVAANFINVNILDVINSLDFSNLFAL